jgi:hypothetical protein
MHDVVSHAVSLMVIQVGAARMELEASGGAPAEVGQLHSAQLYSAQLYSAQLYSAQLYSAQLYSAERTGREALDALRRSLGVLRGSLP